MVEGFNLCLLGHFVHFMPSSARNVLVYYGRLPLSFKILL